MEISRKELLSVLESVKPGVASKDANDSMAYFLFSGTDVVTYNDKISIQHPFKTPFSLFVKASDLHKIMSRLTEDKIIATEKGNKLNIKCKTMIANLSTIQDDEISERIANVHKSLKGSKWAKLPENFCDSISLCAFFASTQESDQTLTCVHVNGSDCISSDNKRISHAVLDSPLKTMFVKASEIKNLIAIHPVKYAISKAWLHFKNEDGCIFSIRKMDGKFPEFLPFFDFDGTEINLPQDILEGMDIASIFAEDSDPSINIKISKGNIIISVKSDAGTIQHRSKIDYDGDDISFIINPSFLKQMMTHSSSIIVAKDKARLETDNFRLVTALYDA